jgi:hypothetical protein
MACVDILCIENIYASLHRVNHLDLYCNIYLHVEDQVEGFMQLKMDCSVVHCAVVIVGMVTILFHLLNLVLVMYTKESHMHVMLFSSACSLVLTGCRHSH